MTVPPRVLVELLPIRTLLIGATAVMAVCARAPAAGAGWRGAFVLAALAAAGLVVVARLRDGYSRRAVLGLALVLRLLMLPLPPGLSDDGYRYVWDGLVQIEAHINPYRYVPSDPALSALHDAPIYARLNSAGYFSIYPPVSQLVFAAGAVAYPFGWEASWYLIKLLIVMAEFSGLWLLSRMVPPAALLLYAWNPLVTVEVAGQAHTDALVIPLLLLAVWAVRERRAGIAGASVAAAGWVKLLPFVVLPLVARRAGWRAVVGFGVAAGVLLAPYAAAYVAPHVRSSLALYVALFEFNAGPYYALKGGFYALTGADWSKQLGPALAVLYLAVLPALYVMDARKRGLSLALMMVLALGAFLAFATTVHPWYLLLLLVLVPLIVDGPARRLALSWLWLAAFSMATYVYYTGPAWGYPVAVAVGWGGWGVLTAWGLLDLALPTIMRARAESKWRWIRPHLPASLGSQQVLDLGAGEGYVGAIVQEREGADVVLADVVDFNRTVLPFVRCDGPTLPFEGGSFDLVLLIFVLHHARDPIQLLKEAKRVTRGSVVVVESVVERPTQGTILALLDRLANRLRSGGAMREQEATLRLRSDREWRVLFGRLGFEVVADGRRGRAVHLQRLYLLNPLLQ